MRTHAIRNPAYGHTPHAIPAGVGVEFHLPSVGATVHFCHLNCPLYHIFHIFAGESEKIDGKPRFIK